MSAAIPKISAVLFDADGVVQRPTPDWLDELRLLCGTRENIDSFVQDVFKAEEPALTGKGDFPAALASVLQKWDSPASVSDALSVWTMIDPDHSILGLVNTLRHSGIVVALATNQQRHRAEFMLNQLGYIDLFDHILCSCFIGHAKPGHDYFRKCVEIVGIPADKLLFIDDHDRNVKSAREAGLHAQRFHLDDGLDSLRGILESYDLKGS